MPYTLYTRVKRGVFSRRLTHEVVEKTLKELNAASAVLSVHCIGDTRMRRLNATYRGKDKTTDVLSFSSREGMRIDMNSAEELEDWGDIFINIPQIYRQAKEFLVRPKEEYARMLIHGILHLAGYDHIKPKDARVMFPLQEKILRSINIDG